MYNKYEFLFPFNKVPVNSNIVIYGAGDLGQDYLKQVVLLNYCNVVCMLDREYEKYDNLCVSVYDISYIDKINFEYVIVALKSDTSAQNVIDKLIEYGVLESKIIYTGIYQINPCINSTYNIKDVREKCQNKFITLAFSLYGCGYGDTIITKKIVDRLLEIESKIHIDIYCTGKIIDFLPVIYEDERVKFITPYDIGGDYEEKKKDYMISFQWNHLLRIDNFDKNAIASISLRFLDLMERLLLEINKYQNLSIFEVRAIDRYMGRNVYTSFYYKDVLGIDDMIVKINDQICKDIKIPLKYITLDLSDENNGKKWGKLWPREYYLEFIELFKSKYKNVEIVQIGAEDSGFLPGIYRLTGINFYKVKYVLKNSILHIGSEGGMIHFATQIGTKCVCLFGISPIWYYGYPQNINITANVCYPCNSLLTEANECARSLEQPECMYAIKPVDIMVKIEKYMKSQE